MSTAALTGEKRAVQFCLLSQDVLTVQHTLLISARWLRLVLFVHALETIQTCPETKLNFPMHTPGHGLFPKVFHFAQANATAAVQFCRFTLNHFSY